MGMICFVVGTRPNLMKTAPVLQEMVRHGHQCKLVHTGQHYDQDLFGQQRTQLGLVIHHNLQVGSGTHAEQTAHTLVRFERYLLEHKPTLVVVSGDVNSSLAGALAAAKLNIPVVHIESGLRSHDRTMPEEVNRTLIDKLATLRLCPSHDAASNLRREGIYNGSIKLVGNTMIDSLKVWEPTRLPDNLTDMGLEKDGYVLVTLHRPALVDDHDKMTKVMAVLEELAGDTPVLFPVHPRTRRTIESLAQDTRIKILPPMDYWSFLGAEKFARFVITDSGGVQEETTYFGTPCATFRSTTERPITTWEGSNKLIGVDVGDLRKYASDPPARRKCSIAYWDGKAAERTRPHIEQLLEEVA